MSNKTIIAIGSDHAGVELKTFLQQAITNVEWKDVGPSTTDRVDYPDYAALVSQKVIKGKTTLGLLICGSGIGMSISANKIAGIRAAVVESEVAARLSKQHNNSNVLCLGARILAKEYAKEIVQAWLGASFEGGRHTGRIEKIKDLESGAANAKQRKP